jgi:hypothetical protein
MYPNSALSAWQLAIMAVVPVMVLAAWLTAVYLAARDTGGRKQATAGSPPESAAAGKGSRSLSPAQEPGRPPADRAAA